MDRKNEPTNFKSADDEMFAFLSSLGDCWQVSEGGARFIEENFAFIGFKPVLRGFKRLCDRGLPQLCRCQKLHRRKSRGKKEDFRRRNLLSGR